MAHVQEDNTLDWSECDKDGERRSDFGFTLEIIVTGFVDEVNVRYKRIKDVPHIFSLNRKNGAAMS